MIQHVEIHEIQHQLNRNDRQPVLLYINVQHVINPMMINEIMIYINYIVGLKVPLVFAFENKNSNFEDKHYGFLVFQSKIKLNNEITIKKNERKERINEILITKNI